MLVLCASMTSVRLQASVAPSNESDTSHPPAGLRDGGSFEHAIVETDLTKPPGVGNGVALVPQPQQPPVEYRPSARSYEAEPPQALEIRSRRRSFRRRALSASGQSATHRRRASAGVTSGGSTS
jgi:hypothetical protein